MSMTVQTVESPREAIRQELEETRANFHKLLDSVPVDMYHLLSANPAWTVGEVLYHMSVALKFLPADVSIIRRFGRLPRPPAFIFNALNEWYTQWGGRKATYAYLAQKYDDAHARTLEALDSIGDDEWQKGVDYPDWDPLLSGYVTLERLFHYPSLHFQSHSQELQALVEIAGSSKDSEYTEQIQGKKRQD
jgi:hypothetical protein